MNLKRNILVFASLAAFCTPVVFGRVTGQSIQNRKENQQDRIAQGVKSGQLTPRETSNLEHKETGINHEEHAMRRADGGKLTQGDKRVINHQQNHVSRQIYNKKHNARKS